MRQQRMRFKSAFIKEGKLWCVPSVMNWLFTIDLEDWSVEAVCDLGLGDELQIDAVFEHEGYVWCVPDKGEMVVGYDMRTRKVEQFERSGGGFKRNRDTIFYKGRLWIIPIELPWELVSFDICEKRFAVHESWKKECIKWGMHGKIVSLCHVGGMVYMAWRDGCKIVQFNLEEERMKVQALPGEFGLFCILHVRNEVFVTSFKKRKLFRWNEKTGEIKKIDCPYLQDRRYIRGVEFEDDILLTDGESVDSLDRKKETIAPYGKLPKELKNDYKINQLFPLFFGSLVYGTRYFLIPWMANMLLEYDGKSGEWKGHTLKIPAAVYEREYAIKKLKKDRVANEDEIPLELFIRYVEEQPDRQKPGRVQASAGYQIYKQLVKEE